jgi:hypothetical protein
MESELNHTTPNQLDDTKAAAKSNLTDLKTVIAGELEGNRRDCNTMEKRCSRR